MIIWLNGSFGSGKTTTAEALNIKIKDSFIYDPENIGGFINDNIPNSLKKNDFQDYTLWRALNVRIIEEIYNNYQGTIIIPMTLVEERYFSEIILNLIEKNIKIEIFTLISSKETLIQRLNLRGQEGKWAISQINRCVNALESDFFKNKISTDNMNVDEVVNEIMKKCNLN